jgi:aspartate kinase
VAGVYNADPKRHADAVKLPQLSYREVMEMANYGAKVIHPKTLKPLENGGIPLLVRSFTEPATPGTDISSEEPDSYPPVIVHTDDLILLTIRLKDLSYIHTQHVNQVFQLLQDYRARTYLTQIAFMHLSIALQLDADRLEPLVEDLQKIFEVRYNIDLELITIRHYSDADIAGLSKDRTIYLEQRSRATTRLLIG